MKLHTVDTPVYGSSDLKMSKFKIATSAKAFRILSSNLYKHKIRAIIRELSCNAVDGHIASKLAGGNPPSQFDVTLPSIFDHQFKIRDYGIGLSNDDVLNLYSTYFASTKSETNDMTGALGLGSKSPFAYTDTFSVCSWFNGTKSSYSAFIQDGEPSIVLVHQEASTEPNGVEITVPVGSNDVNKWAEEANRVYISFEHTRPNFIGRADYVQYIKYTNDVCVSDRTNEYGSGVFAVMGGVVYPIPSEYWDNSFISLWAHSKAYYIKFELGELDITPSREELSLDPDTVIAIQNRMGSTNKSYDDELDAMFASATDIFDLHKKVNAKFTREVWRRVIDKKVYRGRTIAEWKQRHGTFEPNALRLLTKVTLTADQSIRRVDMKMRNSYGQSSSVQTIVDFDRSFTPVIINDIKSGYNELIRGLHVLNKVNLNNTVLVFDVMNNKKVDAKNPSSKTLGELNNENLMKYLSYWPNRMKTSKVFRLSEIRDNINAELKAKGLEKVKKARTGIAHNSIMIDKTGVHQVKMYAEDIDDLDGVVWFGSSYGDVGVVTERVETVDVKGTPTDKVVGAVMTDICGSTDLIEQWCAATDRTCYIFKNPQYRRALKNANIVSSIDDLVADATEMYAKLTANDVPCSDIPAWVRRLNNHPITKVLYNQLVKTQSGNDIYNFARNLSSARYALRSALPMDDIRNHIDAITTAGRSNVNSNYEKFTNDNYVLYRLLNNVYDVDDPTAKNIMELVKM